ncbi:MAG: hypothetical protein JSR21_21730, partial [Proteobacteria bacterium]|nr:hypothetical protein [Pseudomonadota bacterium]
MPLIRGASCALIASLCMAAPLPGTAATKGGSSTGNCTLVDPTNVLAGIAGDFELAADPDDPQGGVIFVSNTTGRVLAQQNLVVAKLDGATGNLVPGSLTVVADNFYGNSYINGPEWFRSPQGNLGIIYPGPTGMTMAMRSATPATWNAFSYDYTGAPSNGSPAPLPNAIPGAYVMPPNQPPATESYYGEFGGNCGSICYANYQGGTATDIGQVLSTQGYALVQVQPSTWDGTFYYSACKSSGGSCGIWTASIDGNGGLTSQVQVLRTNNQAARQMAAYVHPLTGQALLFTNGTATSIAVWTQAAPGAPLTQLAMVPVQPGAIHFRAVASDTQVVLNFLVEPKRGVASGVYSIAVSAANGTMTAGPATLLNTFVTT